MSGASHGDAKKRALPPDLTASAKAETDTATPTTLHRCTYNGCVKLLTATSWVCTCGRYALCLDCSQLESARDSLRHHFTRSVCVAATEAVMAKLEPLKSTGHLIRVGGQLKQYRASTLKDVVFHARASATATAAAAPAAAAAAAGGGLAPVASSSQFGSSPITPTTQSATTATAAAATTSAAALPYSYDPNLPPLPFSSNAAAARDPMLFLFDDYLSASASSSPTPSVSTTSSISPTAATAAAAASSFVDSVVAAGATPAAAAAASSGGGGGDGKADDAEVLHQIKALTDQLSLGALATLAAELSTQVASIVTGSQVIAHQRRRKNKKLRTKGDGSGSESGIDTDSNSDSDSAAATARTVRRRERVDISPAAVNGWARDGIKLLTSILESKTLNSSDRSSLARKMRDQSTPPAAATNGSDNTSDDDDRVTCHVCNCSLNFVPSATQKRSMLYCPVCEIHLCVACDRRMDEMDTQNQTHCVCGRTECLHTAKHTGFKCNTAVIDPANVRRYMIDNFSTNGDIENAGAEMIDTISVSVSASAARNLTRDEKSDVKSESKSNSDSKSVRSGRGRFLCIGVRGQQLDAVDGDYACFHDRMRAAGLERDPGSMLGAKCSRDELLRTIESFFRSMASIHVLYYSGHSKAGSGNWMVDPTSEVSLEDVMACWKRARVQNGKHLSGHLLIFLDSCYGGEWVEFAMRKKLGYRSGDRAAEQFFSIQSAVGATERATESKIDDHQTFTRLWSSFSAGTISASGLIVAYRERSLRSTPPAALTPRAYTSVGDKSRRHITDLLTAALYTGIERFKCDDSGRPIRNAGSYEWEDILTSKILKRGLNAPVPVNPPPPPPVAVPAPAPAPVVVPVSPPLPMPVAAPNPVVFQAPPPPPPLPLQLAPVLPPRPTHAAFNAALRACSADTGNGTVCGRTVRWTISPSGKMKGLLPQLVYNCTATDAATSITGSAAGLKSSRGSFEHAADALSNALRLNGHLQ